MLRYSTLPLVRRVLIGASFLTQGIGKLLTYAATISCMKAAGMPFPPVAFIFTILFELGGGFTLLLGYRVQLVSIALAVFSVVAALYFHSSLGDRNQMIPFLKSLMIAGGLLQVAYFGAGSLSLDARLKRSKSIQNALNAT